MKTYRLAAAAALALGAGLAPLASAHEIFTIGHSAAGRLVEHHEFPFPFTLPQSIFTGFDGWAAVEPGFESLGESRPADDFFALPATSNIEFELIAIDPGLLVWNDTGSAPMVLGERFTMGSPFFHIITIWQMPPTTGPGVYSATIVLHDTTGQYTASEPITLSFIRSCPADLNADGLIDFGDYLEFLNLFDAEDPTVDYNQDGIVDFSDYLEFLNHYDAEC